MKYFVGFICKPNAENKIIISKEFETLDEAETWLLEMSYTYGIKKAYIKDRELDKKIKRYGEDLIELGAK